MNSHKSSVSRQKPTGKRERRLHFNKQNIVATVLFIAIFYSGVTTYLLFYKSNKTNTPRSNILDAPNGFRSVQSSGDIRKRQFRGEPNGMKSQLSKRKESFKQNESNGSESTRKANPIVAAKDSLTNRQEKPTPKKDQSVDPPSNPNHNENNVLTAYIEPIDQEEWERKPLPMRKNAQASRLTKMDFPSVSSCTKLPQQWPVDEEDAPTNKDPFLPWIHDVFPSADGKYIQFIAQNKRRCQSGTKKAEIKKFMQPNIALFQHVPIKRIENVSWNETSVSSNGDQQRYRLASHEDADEDGMEARFICRFKPSMQETLSVHNLNYDYHTWRKAYQATFTSEGFDNHMIWTSQLLFRCPVPKSLQKIIMEGTSIRNDYATNFVDLIPIRTPPRYGPPMEFLPPKYGRANTLNATEEWGNSHVLPVIEDSGRWEVRLDYSHVSQIFII